MPFSKNQKPSENMNNWMGLCFLKSCGIFPLSEAPRGPCCWKHCQLKRFHFHELSQKQLRIYCCCHIPYSESINCWEFASSVPLGLGYLKDREVIHHNSNQRRSLWHYNKGGGGHTHTNISILLEGFPSEDHVRTSLSNAAFCRSRQPLRCCPAGRGGEGQPPLQRRAEPHGTLQHRAAPPGL